MSAWVRPAGTARRDGWDALLPPGGVLEHAGIAVRSLDGGEETLLAPDDTERLLVPLGGRMEADVEGRRYELARSGDVFDAAPDVLYLPAGCGGAIRADAGGARLLVASARAEEAGEVQFLPAAAAPLEVRGEPPARREIRWIGGEQLLRAQRLLVCEVITPPGGWSSYPPHKHDEARPGVETELEEIYYYELGSARALRDRGPAGFHRTFASDSRSIEILTEVRSGDVVLVPYGWHGPCVAPPGAAMYYLNVMAGPDRRAWQVTSHPDYDGSER